MEGVHQFVNNQVYEPDYVDCLPPGYRFCPSPWELIVYYLKKMIENKEHFSCRIHEVNIYNYSPDDLANDYRSCDNEWYFLTPRERECPKRNRPKRNAGDYGKWRATQKETEVHDANGVVVGWKRGLNFRGKADTKTQWLMHEYISKEPNEKDENKFSKFVLCKIYKKERNETDNIDQLAKQVVREYYAGPLAPGYRFCPRPWELIVYYLKAKIENNEHPSCGIHEVNIYNYSPDDLARTDDYRSCDNEWYFLTPREQECPKRNRPKRNVGDYGKWRATQKETEVHDVNGVVVGWKRSLNFRGIDDTKTQWLMHEYISKEPNEKDENKFSKFVLCKIYKKRNETDNINQLAKQVVRVRNDQEKESQYDEASPKRTRLSDKGASTSTSQYAQSCLSLTTSTPNDQLLVDADEQTPSNMIATSFANTLPQDMSENDFPCNWSLDVLLNPGDEQTPYTICPGDESFSNDLHDDHFFDDINLEYFQ